MKILITEQQLNNLINGKILYHGEDIDPDSYNRDVLWLTDDIEYASRAGEKVYKYWVSNGMDVANEDILEHAFEVGEFGDENSNLQDILWDPMSCDSFLDWIIQNDYEAYETQGIDGEYFLCVFPSMAMTFNNIKRIK